MAPSPNDDLAWRAEEGFFNAWPSERSLLMGGYVVRLSGGTSRRVNSVNPLPFADPDPSPILDEAAALYRSIGRPLLFRVPSMAEGLDAGLTRRGFGPPQAPTLTLRAPLTQGPCPVGVDVVLSAAPSAAWLSARAVGAASVPEASAAVARTLALVASPARFAAALVDEEINAVAVGVMSRGLLLIEAVATRPSARRRGLGAAVTLALMDWARSEGAAEACLQVMADNDGAIRLYRRLGFAQTLYGYHYREAPPQPFPPRR